MHTSSLQVVQLLRLSPWEDVKSIYDRHRVSQEQGPQALVEQIERDGGNTFTNILRSGFTFSSLRQGGIGVSYNQILQDCAQKMDVNLQNIPLDQDVEIEEAILLAILQRYLKDAPPEDRESLHKALDHLGQAQKEVLNHLLRGGAMAGGMYLLIREVGQKAVTQALRAILLRVAGVEGGKMVGRLVGAAIPLINVALAAWTLYELAGPAFRKTLPTVIDIALLRLDQLHKEPESQS